MKSYPQQHWAALAGKAVCEELEQLQGQRGNATWDELSKLRLQCPDCLEKTQKRDLGRVALRLEEVDYTRMLNDRGITQEAWADLKRDLDRLTRDLDRLTRDLDRQPYL